MKRPENLGWTIFLLRCADGSYFYGMCKNLNRKLSEINRREGIYFSKHPERLPVEVVYKETQLKFREARAKSRYLKEMTRRLRTKLIETGKWPIGGDLKKYIMSSYNG